MPIASETLHIIMVNHCPVLLMSLEDHKPTRCILVSADDVIHDPVEELLGEEQLSHGPSGTPTADNTRVRDVLGP